MTILSGANLILENQVSGPGTLVIEDDRIVEVRPGVSVPTEASVVDLHDHLVVPGFVDQHVHGLLGFDTLDERDGLREMAERLPAFGVTAFCPTTVACTPLALHRFLRRVRELRSLSRPPGARVLSAHLESNFITPSYRGAQPAHCLRRPPLPSTGGEPGFTPGPPADDFDAEDLLARIAQAGDDVGIVTLAPELDGASALIDRLISAGHRVSLGHSAATFEQGMAAVARGARSVTHLFNRMPPLGHREPGLAGAALASDDAVVELVCDGHHVHPAAVRVAVRAKPPGRVVAVSDATAGAGLPVGTRTTLGGQPVTVRPSGVYLDEGTLAGSVVTMDRAFSFLVNAVGLSLPDAVAMCATTPARELGLEGVGAIVAGALADLTVLDRELRVARTYVAGRLAYQR